MPAPSSLPLLLPLTLSPLLRGAFVVAHALPLVAFMLVPVPAWALGLSVAALGISVLWHVRAWRALRGQCLSLGLDSQLLIDVQGRLAELSFLPSSVDLGWLIVLYWRAAGSGDKLWCWAWTREAMSLADWRQLRLYVRALQRLPLA